MPAEVFCRELPKMWQPECTLRAKGHLRIDFEGDVSPLPFLIVVTMVLLAAVLGALSYYMKKRKGSDPDLVVCESKGVVPEPLES